MFQSKATAWYYGCVGSLAKLKWAILWSNIFYLFCKKKLEPHHTSTFSTIYGFPWKIFMPILRENYSENVISKNEGAVIFQ